ncbi:hypothetical protein K440DRAFT_161210 [Wilcoxina mikolae CBS 423.85]|nr:hypothetical protein K440DRAFT_161210 [Wilcoxina mikolae CBS 423.85]
MIFAHMYKTPNPRRREKTRLSTPHAHQFHIIFLAGLAAGWEWWSAPFFLPGCFSWLGCCMRAAVLGDTFPNASCKSFCNRTAADVGQKEGEGLYKISSYRES